MIARARGLACAAVLLVGGASACLGSISSSPTGIDLDRGVYTITEGALSYRFDAAWRSERLCDRAADPDETKDLAAEMPEAVNRLRRTLLRRLGVNSLDAIPREAELEIQSLRALGYLDS